MSTNRPRYKHIDDVERLDYYEKGGYHPLQTGDYLQKRYRIVHKLGFGSYSTIWLVRDEQLSKYVAIKVGTASSNHKEIDILSRLANHPAGDKSLGTSLIPPVLDRFNVHGPNGTHPCFVTVPAMCSLADAIAAGDHEPFQTSVARSLAAQLAMAVAHMHSVGFVHGDLHFGNLLLQLPAGLDDLTVQQLYDQYDMPEPEPVVPEEGQPLSLPGVPAHVYAPIWMGKPSNEISLGESKLFLADFGTAFCPDEEPRFESYTPLEIRPPEARFEPTQPLTFASDAWSLGCMIWAILGVKPFLGAWLFGPESAAAAQIDALGPMPYGWWEKWQAKTKTESFDGNGRPKPGREVWTFEQRFEDSIQQPRREGGMEVIADDEREAIFEMIKGMLKFCPCDRMTVQQVLETEWMRKWAIPGAEKSWQTRDTFF
ncbi:Sodium/potassium-transporting ATPase subunit alpha-1 [Verticillium dahliae VDG2]|nr:Sodium/potassium-transporting ATPase subunit alpha-1 [Verticillium dahliae VDG2]